MGETVMVRQDSAFGTEFWATDPEKEEDPTLYPVHQLAELTPYGMLLASLGSCTAILLHTYAQNHGVRLQEVELRVTYERVFRRDCENCETDLQYEESIEQQVGLIGDLSPKERTKLLHIAEYCPIHKILMHGILVKTRALSDQPSPASHQH